MWDKNKHGESIYQWHKGDLHPPNDQGVQGNDFKPTKEPKGDMYTVPNPSPTIEYFIIFARINKKKTVNLPSPNLAPLILVYCHNMEDMVWHPIQAANNFRRQKLHVILEAINKLSFLTTTTFRLHRKYDQKDTYCSVNQIHTRK